MAYQPMFNIGGGFDPMSLYESEEERRRREQEEAIARGEIPAGPVAPTEPTPIKQTITIDPVTGEQKMKLEGSVQDLSAANPMTPTVSMPGQPVAGPVAPASGPSPEELLREQEQRRQYELMMAQPPVAPVAPAQPPVQMAAAPTPTRTDVTAPITGPVPPTAPAQPKPSDLQYEAQGIQEGPTAREAAMAWGNIANVNRDNPTKLMALAQDTNMPDNWRKIYGDIAKTNLEQERNLTRGEAKGQRAMQTGRTDGVLQREVEPGSVGFYAKMYLLRALGFEEKYQDEMRKTKTTFQQVMGDDNKPYTVEVRGDGLVVRGFDQEGQPVDDKTLTALGAQTSVMKGAQPGQTRVRDQAGTEWSVVQTPQGPVFYNNQRQRGTPVGKTVPIGIGSDLDLAFQREAMQARIKLESLKASERIKTWEGLNAIRAKEGKPLFSLGDLGLDASGEFTTRAAQPTQAISPQFGGPAAAPAAPAAPVAPAAVAPAARAPAAPVAPSAVPIAPAGAPETTGAIERTAEARKEIVKSAADVIKNQANIVKDLGDAQRNIKILESGKTNFGTIISGTLPYERAIGETFKTEDAVRTKSVMEYINKISASNVKALGTNPTDRDLIFVTSNIPDETWGEKDVANWIRRSEKGLRNTIRIAREQIRTGGAYEEPLPPEESAGSTGQSTAPSTGGIAPGTEKTYQGRTYIFDGRGWKEKR